VYVRAVTGLLRFNETVECTFRDTLPGRINVKHESTTPPSFCTVPLIVGRSNPKQHEQLWAIRPRDCPANAGVIIIASTIFFIVPSNAVYETALPPNGQHSSQPRPHQTT
jgi:hypothetical protein